MRAFGRRGRDAVERLLSRLRPFTASSSTELRAIGRSCTLVSREAGAVLVAESKPSKEFFVVASGSALVTRGGLADVVLREGGSFGAADLVAKRPSARGLVALSNVELIVMSGGEFGAAMDAAPSFRRYVMRMLAERARANGNTPGPALVTGSF